MVNAEGTTEKQSVLYCKYCLVDIRKLYRVHMGHGWGGTGEKQGWKGATSEKKGWETLV